ncbi:DUF3883 domain-containing protein [Pedobacter aquatilis]|uniref:DUF3883 domain-containing protein n=1 Tax=Pedobacter aquatilis TaxID=351343 RepID=UPI00292CB92A|nr:DUF3883 domain-containing protein [Pedobacter aquatilis]
MDNELRIKLIDLARERRLIGYGNIMFSYDLKSDDRKDVDLFAEWIGEISEWEHEHGRPMLSSLVMHSDLQSIGAGFYGLAEKLSFGEMEDLRKAHFEKVMHRLCYECWSDDELYFKETGKKPKKIVQPYPLYPDDTYPEGITEVSEDMPDFSGSEVDWFEKYQQNIFIGSLGEELVIEYEQRVLIDNGFDKLASKVRKVLDGEGFDVLSFDMDGTEKYIEVKTTCGAKGSPFHISRNEVFFSQYHKEKFYLYRLFNLDVEARKASFNCYSGDLRDHFHLDPGIFIAYNKKKDFS